MVERGMEEGVCYSQPNGKTRREGVTYLKGCADIT